MLLDNLAQELKDHQEVGDAALSKFNNIYDDLTDVLGVLEGTKAKNEIYGQAQGAVLRDPAVKTYLERIPQERNQDLGTIDTSYSPRLEAISKKMLSLRQEIVKYQTEQPESENGIRDRYSGRIKELKSNIGMGKNRKANAESDSQIKIAPIQLSPDEEDVFRRLNDTIEDAREKANSQVAEVTGANPKDVNVFEDPYKDSEELKLLKEKVSRKDKILAELKTQLEPIDEKISEHRAALEGEERKMYAEINNLNEEVKSVVNNNSTRIETLKGNYSALDIQFTGSLRNKETDAIYLQDQIKWRFSEFYRNKFASIKIAEHRSSKELAQSDNQTAD